MTINPARLLKHADKTGSIEPGKFADLVILDQNLFDLAPEAIREAQSMRPCFKGKPSSIWLGSLCGSKRRIDSNENAHSPLQPKLFVT